jgi:LPS-assembly lipoprotein
MLVLITCWVLSGCGFHLRGMTEVPPWLSPIALVFQNTDQNLASQITRQLQANHIHVIENTAAAQYLLIIDQDQFQQQISSISSSTTPRQYQLIYTVHFRLQQINGPELLPLSPVIVNRLITMNSERILGSTNEAEQTKQEMQRDAAIQIMDRLGRIDHASIPRTKRT